MAKAWKAVGVCPHCGNDAPRFIAGSRNPTKNYWPKAVASRQQQSISCYRKISAADVGHRNESILRVLGP